MHAYFACVCMHDTKCKLLNMYACIFCVCVCIVFNHCYLFQALYVFTVLVVYILHSTLHCMAQYSMLSMKFLVTSLYYQSWFYIIGLKYLLWILFENEIWILRLWCHWQILSTLVCLYKMGKRITSQKHWFQNFPWLFN
jgi:hypothetical protein